MQTRIWSKGVLKQGVAFYASSRGILYTALTRFCTSFGAVGGIANMLTVGKQTLGRWGNHCRFLLLPEVNTDRRWWRCWHFHNFWRWLGLMWRILAHCNDNPVLRKPLGNTGFGNPGHTECLSEISNEINPSSYCQRGTSLAKTLLLLHNQVQLVSRSDVTNGGQ